MLRCFPYHPGRAVCCLLVLAALFGASLAAEMRAFEAAARLGTGVNLGNGLEAAPEWGWKLPMEKRYFEAIKQAGFESVRIPVRWSAYAEQESPYTIDPDFFETVDRAVHLALEQDLWVVLNLHHYLELFDEPDAHRDRFLGLWRQIATHYQDLPASVFFEPLNEPNTKLTPDKWNALIPQVLSVIRESNPDRMLVIDVANWSNVEYTPQLILPEQDRNLILSFHYYSPHSFTHQGTSWSAPRFRNLSGIEWLGTEEEKAALRVRPPDRLRIRETDQPPGLPGRIWRVPQRR